MKNSEQKYKEALERAKKLYEQGTITESLCYVFPELNESEDERMREMAIKAVHAPEAQSCIKSWGINPDDVIAWLEKQKEFVSADFDDVWETADCDELTAPLEKYSKDAIKKMCHAWYDKGIELERRNWSEKQGEQKPNDKVEPKFHEDDWITNGDYTWKILEVALLDYILQSQDGNIVDDTISYVDEQFHLWTIQDAKDGDVLVNGSNIFIFHFLNDMRLMGYCHVNTDDGKFYNDIGKNECFCLIDAVVNPASKKQRDLLFQKMKEAGYEWDSVTKKIKRLTEFKVGNWITNGRYIRLVVGVDSRHYQFENGDAKYIDDIDKKYRLWTIADAKEGDVLSFNDGHGNDCIELIKSITGEKLEFWFCLTNGNRYEVFDGITPYSNLASRENSTPATKEQRELLFQKMEEAGYAWNANKRELKKIESKTLDPDKVIEWLKYCNLSDYDIRTSIIPDSSPTSNPHRVRWLSDDFINKFKKDFGLWHNT